MNCSWVPIYSHRFAQLFAKSCLLVFVVLSVVLSVVPSIVLTSLEQIIIRADSDGLLLGDELRLYVGARQPLSANSSAGSSSIALLDGFGRSTGPSFFDDRFFGHDAVGVFDVGDSAILGVGCLRCCCLGGYCLGGRHTN
jgi:hypothetical protein